MTNKNIPDEDFAWLQAHKQNVERRARMLKGAGVFFYCIALLLALSISVTLATHSALAFALIAFVIFLVLAAIFIVTNLPDKYAGEVVADSISGIIIGTAITLIYIIPMISISQYPISMQVFYPNHPNLTITQNCTDFTTSVSGYINGQPMNPKNTTQCNLPPRMTQNATEPFTCGIIGKKITCINAIFGVGNEVWQGTILNVSKR
jgi:hypothetical protein